MYLILAVPLSFLTRKFYATVECIKDKFPFPLLNFRNKALLYFTSSYPVQYIPYFSFSPYSRRAEHSLKNIS